MERRTVYRATTRYILFGFAILVGLVWARFAGEISGWWCVVLAMIALAGFRRARILSVYVMILFGFSLGWWRGALFMNEVRFLDTLAKEQVIITGTALSDSVYDDRGAIAFDINNLLLTTGAEQKPIVGKIGVSGYGERMVYRGDSVRVTGKFYSGRGSYVAWLSYAELEVVARSQSKIFAATREFSAGMQSALPEPQASFGLGLLIGQRDTLPENTTQTLAAVGLTHIIAVSGYNLTILVRATRRGLAKRSKFQATIAALGLIAVFLVATGASPSIVRASIISILSIGAWYYGRSIRPMVLISLTAAGTALWNPLYVWSDIGWYLSFLAFFGVMIVAPVIQKRFFYKKPQGIVGGMVTESVSAQLMTLPLILYIFNDSSFVALLANVLVVPLIPLAMLLSLIAGLAGALVPVLAGWVAWPAKWLLTYILDIAELVSRIPGMEFSVRLSAAQLALAYMGIIGVSFVAWQKSRQNATITDTKDRNIVV
jgi:competence protein ComEC